MAFEVAGQGRVWNLGKDVVDTVQVGNPHADGYGNPDVWRFYAAAAGPLAPPAASEPPFPLDSNARTAAEFRQELKARNLQTIRQLLESQLHCFARDLDRVAVRLLRCQRLPPLLVARLQFVGAALHGRQEPAGQAELLVEFLPVLEHFEHDGFVLHGRLHY